MPFEYVEGNREGNGRYLNKISDPEIEDFQIQIN